MQKCYIFIIETNLVFIVDESKTSATASMTIQNNLDLLQSSKSLELCLQFPLTCVEAQSKHSKTLAWLRVISVALMTSSAGHWRARVAITGGILE